MVENILGQTSRSPQHQSGLIKYSAPLIGKIFSRTACCRVEPRKDQIIAPSSQDCMMFCLVRPGSILNLFGANWMDFRNLLNLPGIQSNLPTALSTLWYKNSEPQLEAYIVESKKMDMSTVSQNWQGKSYISLRLLKIIGFSLGWNYVCVTNSNYTHWLSLPCNEQLHAVDLVLHGSVKAMPIQPCFTHLQDTGRGKTLSVSLQVMMEWFSQSMRKRRRMFSTFTVLSQ